MPRKPFLAVFLAAATLAAACVPLEPAAGVPAAEGPLVSSLSVRTGETAVHFLLQVTNASESPVEVVLPSGQSYDFAVRQGTRDLWRWSDGMFFTQAVRNVWMAPGETMEFAEEWSPPAGTVGELEAEGLLASTSHPLRNSAVFRLP
jgi:hypothetical protein